MVAPRHLNGLKVGDAVAATVDVPLAEAIAAKPPQRYDLLYIAGSVDRASLVKILASHQQVAIPTVATRPGFAAMGGGVQLFVQDNCVRFEINADVLKKQGLHVGAPLHKHSKQGPR
jgi:hypothetical protein